MKVDSYSAELAPIHQAHRDSQARPASKWQKIAATIGDIAKKTLFGLLGTAFFLTNPSIFAIGFIVGIVWEDKVKEAVDKVILIWKKQTWGMVLITGVASFLSLQVTWAAASFLYATNLGSLLSRRAQDLLEEERARKKVIV